MEDPITFFGGSDTIGKHTEKFTQLSDSKSGINGSMAKFLEITVSDSKKLEDLQADFSACFTFLKIEFFKSPHKIGEGSAKSLIYDRKRFVRDCRVKHNEGTFKISEAMTVNELEEKFLADYGLSVQVFRKSGNVWLETSATDGWTLRQQNDEGAELSQQMRASDKNNYDDLRDITS